ncbi:MAG: DUF3887 domain-containing protein [Candidatus Eremiobacteraeota bacterium]|nr:DUF3887 domain-containing protein [Candidatus Eremiobacteraeota bacterium]
MNKSKILSIFLVIFFLFILSSASVFAETDAQMRTIAEPMMDNILESIKNRDRNQYVKDFDSAMKMATTKKSFIETCDFIKSRFGDYDSREFYKVEKEDGYIKVIWKAKYSKAEKDVRLEIFLKKYDNKWLIFGILFT